jgi:hypothetical protein
VRVVVVVAVVRKISLSCRVCEISSRINNEVMRHLHDVVQRLMARQMEWKKGFQMQFKKKRGRRCCCVVVVENSEGRHFPMRECGCAGESRFARSHIDKVLQSMFYSNRTCTVRYASAVLRYVLDRG